MDSHTTEIRSLPALATIANNMSFCDMNEAILVDNQSDKSIIMTEGVGTCLAIVIHHPATKVTLFSHMSSSIDILKQQEQFVAIVESKGIRLEELYVYLAGGLPSFFESKQAAEVLDHFWRGKKVIINTELLLCRDTVVVEDYKDFLSNINRQLDRLGIAKQDIQDFMDEVITPSDCVLYMVDRPYSSAKKGIYSRIEIAMGEIIKCYLTNSICTKNYIKENKLLAAQFVHNPQNKDEKRVVISFRDPHKAVLHFIGFDLIDNKLFISTDDCSQLIGNVRRNTCKKKLGHASVIPMLCLDYQIPNYQGTVPVYNNFVVSSPSTKYSHVYGCIKKIVERDKENLGKYLDLFNQRQYSQVVITACSNLNSINPNKNLQELLTIMLCFKEDLSININAYDDVGNTAIHYAALNNNMILYEFLRSEGANPDLPNEQGSTAASLLPKNTASEVVGSYKK